MVTINAFIDKVRVVLTAAVTWITAAVVILQVALAQNVISDVPEATSVIGQIIVWLLGAIAIIRRVTPVASDERGIV